MALTAHDIETMIRTGLPDAQVTVEDMGDGAHYSARVVSPSFEGKSRVQQHQMVYATLQDSLKGELHALALQTSSS